MEYILACVNLCCTVPLYHRLLVNLQCVSAGENNLLERVCAEIGEGKVVRGGFVNGHMCEE